MLNILSILNLKNTINSDLSIKNKILFWNNIREHIWLNLILLLKKIILLKNINFREKQNQEKTKLYSNIFNIISKTIMCFLINTKIDLINLCNEYK